jgi:hypothetical protein
MTDDRAEGPTFALENIAFIDFESRSPTPIKSGTWRYATEADAIVLAFAIGDAPVQVISVPDFQAPLSWSDAASVRDGVLKWDAQWAALRCHHDRDATRHGSGNGSPDGLRQRPGVAATQPAGPRLQHPGAGGLPEAV